MLHTALSQVNTPWYRALLLKMHTWMEYARSVPPDRLLFLIDSRDVLWGGCDTDLVAAFERFNKTIVFGAEYGCYPVRRPCQLPQQHSPMRVTSRMSHALQHATRPFDAPISRASNLLPICGRVACTRLGFCAAG